MYTQLTHSSLTSYPYAGYKWQRGCVQAADQLPVLYLILREGAEVDAGVGRAYGVRDFYFYKVFSMAFGEGGEWGSGPRSGCS